MDFMGLTRKYPVNRPLTEMERALQLKQKMRLNVEPHYQLSIIKMNSNFLESVDKWFGWKGVISGVALAAISMMATFYVAMLQVTFTRENTAGSASDDMEIMTMVTLMILPVAFAAVWTLLKESFAYTHYPIRFDRKNREVHIFRTNGSVVSARWNDIFFTLGELRYGGGWEVRGHILGPERNLVLETFSLSYVGSVSAKSIAREGKSYSDDDYLHAHWEFIRRYMEEGPQYLSRQVQFCMPVDAQREKARISVERIFANFASAPGLLRWMSWPLCLVIGFFRVISMRTCKIPMWPATLEARCTIDPDDPYAIEGGPHGERKAVFPEAARAAGVFFTAT